MIEPELLMLAYRSGIFPMADSRDDPEIFWIEPRLRAILPLEGLRLSHSLARTLRRGRFTVTCNAAFPDVMEACAAPRRASEGSEEEGGSWISHRIQASYENLHYLGHAHSIEVWQHGEDGHEKEARPGDAGAFRAGRKLVGGLYGVGFDRAFCGESMFSTVSDASKVALCWLVAALRRGGVSLLDCQFITPHLASLGAMEIPQKRYLALLQAAQSSRLHSSTAGTAAGGDGGPAGLAAGPAGGAALGAGVAGAEVLALPDAFDALLSDAAAAGSASSPGKFIAQALTQTS